MPCKRSIIFYISLSILSSTLSYATKLPFYYINLDKSVGRKQHMQSQVETLKNIAPHRYSAVNGKSLTLTKEESSLFANPSYMQYMKGGEMGCFLSHYHLWKEATKHNITMIGEDDFIMLENFEDNVFKVLKQMQEEEYDIVFFTRHETFNYVPLSIYRYNHAGWLYAGSSCYLINSTAAQSLIDKAQDAGANTELDAFIYHEAKNLKIGYTNESIILNIPSSQSDINLINNVQRGNFDFFKYNNTRTWDSMKKDESLPWKRYGLLLVLFSAVLMLLMKENTTNDTIDKR